MSPGDRVAYPNRAGRASNDRGTVVDDGGQLVVVWDHLEQCDGRGVCLCLGCPADVDALADGRDVVYVSSSERSRADRIRRATGRLR